MEEERKDEMQPPEEGAIPQESTETAPSLCLEGQAGSWTAEIEESNRERDQFRQMLQRVQADFVNYKRRAEDDREELHKFATSRLLLKLLPVLDDFNLAIDHAAKADADSSWLEGIKLIHRKLHSLAESESVTKMEVEGREFDPSEHEAMAYQESADQQEGQILTVVRDGYKLHGRVIRPALVILAKKPEAAGEESSPSTGKETEDA